MGEFSQFYRDYMQSAAWRTYRRQVLTRDKGRCRQCRRRGPVDVHHLTYERLGHERLADCITLCPTCHAARHSHMHQPHAAASGMGCLVLLVAVILGLVVLFLASRQPSHPSVRPVAPKSAVPRR